MGCLLQRRHAASGTPDPLAPLQNGHHVEQNITSTPADRYRAVQLLQDVHGEVWLCLCTPTMQSLMCPLACAQQHQVVLHSLRGATRHEPLAWSSRNILHAQAPTSMKLIAC